LAIVRSDQYKIFSNMMGVGFVTFQFYNASN
jgi:hypothetical protein